MDAKILVFSVDEEARLELSRRLAHELDIDTIPCASLEDIRLNLRHQPRAIVIDHSPGHMLPMAATRWLHAAEETDGVFHLSDTAGPAQPGAKWLPRDGRGLEDAIKAYFMGKRPQTSMAPAVDAFGVTLDQLEKALDTPSSTSAVVRSLMDTHEILEALNFGPSTIELDNVVTLDRPPQKDDVRALITQLKAFVEQRVPGKTRIMMCGRDARANELRSALSDVAVSHVVHRDSLPSACEMLNPHVIVVFDEGDRQTRDTLLQLRMVHPVANPAVVLLGSARPVDRHVAYEVVAAFDADVPLREVARVLTELANERAKEAPHVVIVEDAHRSEDVVAAVERMGGSATVISEPATILDVLFELPTDLVFLRDAYGSVSGFDVCRAIRRASRVPVLMIVEHLDIATKNEAYKAGADDVLVTPLAGIELQRRLRQHVELQRLRVSRADRDELTGVRHVTGLKDELTRRYEGRRDKPVSFAAFEVCNFAAIREKHGEQAARTVLRHVADTLTVQFGPKSVFRGWGERFFVLSDRLYTEDPAAPPWSPVLDINRVTFRDTTGRGFYVSLNAAHLIAVPGNLSVNGFVEGLIRILLRCRTLGTSQLLTARIDGLPDAPKRPETPSQASKRWKPVVLTRSND